MLRQLYDYWFVQFDFPNHKYKRYKSSDGEMLGHQRKDVFKHGCNGG